MQRIGKHGLLFFSNPNHILPKVLIQVEDESKPHGFFSSLYPEEFKSLKYRLQHIHIIHFITHDSGGENKISRLDQTRLEKLLKGWRRKSNVFICGPFEMMKEMTRAVKKIGFSSARVYKEEFKL